MGTARLPADDGTRPGTTVLVGEGARQHVDDLLPTVLVESGQFKPRVPLDNRHVQLLVQAQDPAAASRCLRLPLDVTLGEVTHPGGGSRVRRLCGKTLFDYTGSWGRAASLNVLSCRVERVRRKLRARSFRRGWQHRGK